MDESSERLGVSFCMVGTSKSIVISPGLAALVNGSTSKTTLRRKMYDALPEIAVAQQSCKFLRTKNKVIALFQWKQQGTPFTQASSVLTALGSANAEPKIISVDAMAVGYEKGKVDDHLGCIEASKKHEVVVYENRGEDLSFLKPRKPRTKETQREGPSGAKKVQAKQERQATPSTSTNSGTKMLSAAVGTLSKVVKRAIGDNTRAKAAQTTERVGNALKKFFKPTSPPKLHTPSPKGNRTRAAMGHVEPPQSKKVTGPLDLIINAFLEFLALTKAELEISRRTCDDIMQSYQYQNMGLLRVRLKEADAVIYNNETLQIIHGSGTVEGYMAAYSATAGFVDKVEETEGTEGKTTFKTPSTDPIVVIAKCTKIMLGNKICERAIDIAGVDNESLGHWVVPNFTWVNGVPGCGKTTWIVRNFDRDRDVVVTTTTEAANDLREKLEPQLGEDTKTKVRTMASVLVNGFKNSDRGSRGRLIIDEALMNHFGAIVMATRLAGTDETLMIGDINQLSYIDRNNAFELYYAHPPSEVANINKELLCTHRNPMDVAYALREVYDGVYSSKDLIRSLKLKGYSGAEIPKSTDNTLYLTHTQKEKALLKAEGYGTGQGSRVNTIHEAQGATFETVIIVRTTQPHKKQQLHCEVPHAVVAVSRHTISCTYYCDDDTDAIARFVSRAERAEPGEIRDYNLKMAIKNGDREVMDKILKLK